MRHDPIHFVTRVSGSVWTDYTTNFLLRIRDHHFGLDAALSIKANANLEVAVKFVSQLCEMGNLKI
ncbi:hypothetical protein SAMN05421755_100933 [Nitrosomonas sp. Nm33]|nr:hypothetical protein SAMN05421755_100933 [Nitrosomonas sp. Nm33]